MLDELDEQEKLDHLKKRAQHVIEEDLWDQAKKVAVIAFVGGAAGAIGNRLGKKAIDLVFD